MITPRVGTYYRFRRLALMKNMPPNALVLLDLAYELMRGSSTTQWPAWVSSS
ncbi:MAG: hypothetical protein WCF90_00800 [Methanomicrobiales archaeon]